MSDNMNLMKSSLPLRRLLLPVLPAVLFLPTCFFPFSPLDDYILILQNLDWLGTLGSIPEAFTSTMFQDEYYRPLLTVSFILDAMLGNGSAGMFHITNVILHAVNIALLLHLLRLLDVRRGTAVFLTALAAVHPVQVHAVAWIPGRNDMLLTLFIILSWISWLKVRQKPSPVMFAAHHLMFLAALFTKELAVLFPIAAVILHPPNEKRQFMKLGWFVLFWCLSFFGYIAAAFSVSRSQINAFEIPTLNNMLSSAVALGLYLQKIFIPLNLKIIPTFSNFQPVFFLLAAGMTAVVFLGGTIVRKRQLISGLFLFLSALLVPALYSIQKGYNEFFEHRLYLPLIGLIVAAASLNFKAWKISSRLPVVFSIALVSFLMIISLLRQEVYSDPLVFAETAVLESPDSPKAYSIRGFVFSILGRNREAIEDLSTAIRLNDRFNCTSHFNRGMLFFREQEYESAILDFTVVTEHDSADIEAQLHLALSYFNLNNPEKSEETLNSVLLLKPGHEPGLYYRALSRCGLGRFDMALQDSETLLTICPERSDYQQLHREIEAKLNENQDQ